MQDNNFCYSTPESQGIPSEAISEFIDDLTRKRLAMHSFMLIRHGKVVAEGYWEHFSAEKKQRMYSISKSFTSVAIGMMIDEGKIALDDKVADYFPEYIPENANPHILEATIKNLLTMSTFNSHTSYGAWDKDWVKTFFHDTGIKHKPGTIFSYDTAATVVLCGIVEKISGKPMLEYMRPVLDEIGISKDITCIKSPDGRSWTGSGILCTLRDLSRFALLCMNKGEWNGKQLISRKYMEAATSCQIDNSIMSNDYQLNYGYGYQFWCIKDGGFACLGMGGQVALCLPKYDLILTATADNQLINTGIPHIIDSFFSLVDRIAEKTKEKCIVNYVKTKYNILIGEYSAGELVRKAIAIMHSDIKTIKFGKAEIKGKNLDSGLPSKIELSMPEIREAMEATGNILPDNIAAQEILYKALQEKISSLKIPLPLGDNTTANAEIYSGKKYIMQENYMKIKWISVDITPEKCVMNYVNETGEHSITLGMGKYITQKFPEKYFGETISINDTFYDSIAAGAWRYADTLLGTVYAIDNYLGTIKMQLTFSEDNLSVIMTKAAEWFFDNYQGFATGYAEK